MHRPLICHIIFRLDYGGLENGLVNLINRLPPGCYHHAIVCLTQATEFSKRITVPDLQIFEIGKRPGKDISAYLKVWRVLRRLRPDIVHTRNLPTIDMLGVAALAGIRRLIHGEHGLEVAELGGQHARYNRLRRLSRLVVSHYVAVNRDLGKWLNREMRIPEHRISVIYNGVDTRAFTPSTQDEPKPSVPGLPADSFIIGSIGRLEPIKDHVTLVRAFLRILESRPHLRKTLRLALVGDGATRGVIEDMLTAADARDLAWMPGYQSDVRHLYRRFSVFVLPSRREGISNTLLEAMASGLPVIATRVGGTPEIVTDGEDGLLVPPEDLAALATAILRCHDAPALALDLGRRAHRHVEQKFSIDRMVDEYARLYNLLLA